MTKEEIPWNPALRGSEGFGIYLDARQGAEDEARWREGGGRRSGEETHRRLVTKNDEQLVCCSLWRTEVWKG